MLNAPHDQGLASTLVFEGCREASDPVLTKLSRQLVKFDGKRNVPYQAFEAAVIADYDAESAVERELVLRLASVLWRLRRATGIETALFESVTAELGKAEYGSSRPPHVEAADLSDRNQLHLVATRQFDVAAENEFRFDTKKDIADCFLRLADLPTSALDRLSRYEHTLWRQTRQIAFTLESEHR